VLSLLQGNEFTAKGVAKSAKVVALTVEMVALIMLSFRLFNRRNPTNISAKMVAATLATKMHLNLRQLISQNFTS
jgi:hypothetical protein